MDIVYKSTKEISPRAALGMHRRTQWWDWYTLSDMKWRIEHALYVATAWKGRKMVGMALLTGDGRIDVNLTLLLVDKPCRGNGIGSSLMNMVLAKVERLRPYGLSFFS